MHQNCALEIDNLNQQLSELQKEMVQRNLTKQNLENEFNILQHKMTGLSKATQQTVGNSKLIEEHDSIRNKVKERVKRLSEKIQNC